MKIITRSVTCYDYTFTKLSEINGEMEVVDVQKRRFYEPLTKKILKMLQTEGELAGYICTSRDETEMKMACPLSKFMEIAIPYDGEITVNTDQPDNDQATTDKEENINE